MKVRDILKGKARDTITVRLETKISEAMRLLIVNKISCLPVVNESANLLGIISDKDIFNKIYDDPDNFRASTVIDLMSKDLIVGVLDDEVSYIAGVMTNNRIRHIPIVENKQLTGLVSVGDVVKTQMENIQIENRYLKQYIDGSYPG